MNKIKEKVLKEVEDKWRKKWLLNKEKVWWDRMLKETIDLTLAEIEKVIDDPLDLILKQVKIINGKAFNEEVPENQLREMCRDLEKDIEMHIREIKQKLSEENK